MRIVRWGFRPCEVSQLCSSFAGNLMIIGIVRERRIAVSAPCPKYRYCIDPCQDRQPMFTRLAGRVRKCGVEIIEYCYNESE